jgi:hypothetical protein
MRPENIYPHDVEDHDRNVFLGASHFTVYLPGKGKWDNIPTFPDALEKVGDSRRALIYAVTKSDRSTVLERKKWDLYLALWHKVHKVLTNPEVWEQIKKEASAAKVDPYTSLLHYCEIDPKEFRRKKK